MTLFQRLNGCKDLSFNINWGYFLSWLLEMCVLFRTSLPYLIRKRGLLFFERGA